MKVKLSKIAILLIALIVISSCGTRKENEKMIDYKESKEVTNYVKLEMVNGDEVLIELYPDIAPITVANFKKLVQAKFYDGLIFHRVILNFMIQTGDPLGNGTGGSAEKITGEFTNNDIVNNLSHTKGVVSMARRGDDNNSASSQFFICQADANFLDGDYAAFGKVIDGLATVDKIAKVRVDSNDKPLTEQKIKSITFINIK